MSDQPQVYSRHLAKKGTSQQLSRFDDLLKELMASSEGKPEALGDVTVLELGEANFAALIAGSMLGEFGAKVLKLEPPQGDPARQVTPYGVNVEGVGLPFLMESRNKQHVALDLYSASGTDSFRRLAIGADVVIDGLKPGLLHGLDVGYEQLREHNPRLIYVAVSPYGHFTAKARELANIPDSDLTAQADAGYPALTGDPDAPEPYNYPIRAGIWAAWYMSAALAAAGTLTALFHRRRTGEGQMIDVATHDAITAWQGFSEVWGFTAESPRERIGNLDWCLFPYGYYQAKDGYVTVAAPFDADFRGLLKILGRWDLENDWRNLFDRITDDVARLRVLETEIQKDLAKHTRRELVGKTLRYSAKAARDRLRAKGFPIIVETRSPREVLTEKHWQVRGSFVEMDHPVVGKFTIPAAVPRMSETPPRVKSLDTTTGEGHR